MTLDSRALRNYAWLSQAAYLDLSGLGAGGLSDRLEDSAINADKEFAHAQALEFTDPSTGYSFQAYSPNDDTGFAATVFKSSSDNSYTIAVRGTEGGIFGTDIFDADLLGVVLSGRARDQVVQAYRYFKELITYANDSVTYSTQELEVLYKVTHASGRYKGSDTPKKFEEFRCEPV